jgi:sigma-B regulation protein RsbU (phosphoserine phosphatase)
MGIEREMKAGYVLSKLNRVIHASLLSSRFASLFYGELEENGSFFYYNAGHDPALLITPAGCTELESGDPVLGPLPEMRFRRRFAHLDRGAMLALYTDGVIERRSPSGELFGMERLRQLLLDGLHRSPAELVTECFEAVERFGAADVEKDDATLVIVRRLGR